MTKGEFIKSIYSANMLGTILGYRIPTIPATTVKKREGPCSQEADFSQGAKYIISQKKKPGKNERAMMRFFRALK